VFSLRSDDNARQGRSLFCIDGWKQACTTPNNPGCNEFHTHLLINNKSCPLLQGLEMRVRRLSRLIQHPWPASQVATPAGESFACSGYIICCIISARSSSVGMFPLSPTERLVGNINVVQHVPLSQLALDCFSGMKTVYWCAGVKGAVGSPCT
jgi:hypothetical protein